MSSVVFRAVQRAASIGTLVAVGTLTFSALSSFVSAQDAPKSQPVASAPAPRTPLPLKLAPRPTKSAITADDLMTRLYIFADDSLMGRDAGTEGSFKATALLAREAQRLGLQPAGDSGTFFQTLPLKRKKVDPMSSFIAGGASLELSKEWGFKSGSTMTFNDTPVVFGGVMGEQSLLPAEQVAGKLVVLTVPTSQDAVLQSLDGEVDVPAGAAGIILVEPAQAAGVFGYVLSAGAFVDDPAFGGPRLFVGANVMSKLFALPASALKVGTVGTSVNVKAMLDVTPSPFAARNVVAILPGSDPKLRNQYVAVGAHSDHVGMSRRAVDHDSVLIFNRIVRPGGAENDDKMGNTAQFVQINAELAEMRKSSPTRRDSIFNGADDDGSGSVAVQEIAEMLSTMKVKPKRSTLFVWHVGEEKGLWGSKFFTAHPTVSRDSIVAQLNIDMVGRGSATDLTGTSKDGQDLRGGPDYLQLVGSRRLSTELGDLVESVNTTKKHNLVFDYGMDASAHPMNIYCRSDHYEYAKWGVPVTFFTTGGHSAYHQLTDEPQYIDYPHMERVAKLIADVALELGNRLGRPVVNQPKLDPRGTCKQ
ncbi:M28 family metallopeptidase [Gemmatimonas groenlandica]|uniref:M28 family peptidase n=1 Tax=Gemmatimonas groenlandica TaxID=2732249 RepID=A0A6M4ILC4_9BACT|nr:M28 family peptidase [Gemmatimonas groenlandica]QJR35513.1 M28 family peptidase [Gemmatimonas groenlandica]